jgi:hypothetical protein
VYPKYSALTRGLRERRVETAKAATGAASAGQMALRGRQEGWRRATSPHAASATAVMTTDAARSPATYIPRNEPPKITSQAVAASTAAKAIWVDAGVRATALTSSMVADAGRPQAPIDRPGLRPMGRPGA